MAIDAFPIREDHTVYQGDDWEFTLATTWTAAKTDSAVFSIRTKPNGSLIMSINSTDESGQFDISADNVVTVSVPKSQSQLIDGGMYWYDLELTDSGVETKTARYGILAVQGDISYDDAGGAPLATTSTSDMLIAWTLGELWSYTSITRDAEELVSSASIRWPDNTAGTFTQTAKSGGRITAFTVTYNALTVTQSAMTLDANNNVSARPRPTVA